MMSVKMNLKLNKKYSALALVVLLAGCGVRGRPLPPLTPAELGRGQPTYRKATEDLSKPDTKENSKKEESKGTSR